MSQYYYNYLNTITNVSILLQLSQYYYNYLNTITIISMTIHFIDPPTISLPANSIKTVQTLIRLSILLYDFVECAKGME